MKPYCQDLRTRVVAKAQAGKHTQAAIAATFGVSLSTVEKWLRRKRETGKIAPLPPAHGPKRVLQDHAPLIRAQVKQQPDLTLAELCVRILSCLSITVSPSTMCRELQGLRLPRKKVASRQFAGHAARPSPPSPVSAADHRGMGRTARPLEIHR